MSQNFDGRDERINFNDESTVDRSRVSGVRLSEKDAAVMESIANSKTKMDESKRKDLSLNFAIKLFKMVFWMMATIMAINVVLDFLKVESEVVLNFFEFLKYTGTTLIGYLFASNKE